MTTTAEPSPGADARLTELAGSHWLLAAALDELWGEGLSDATADALVDAPVADGVLAEFLELAVREAPVPSLFGLALSLPHYVDQRGVGHAALDHCLEPRRLAPAELRHVGERMSVARSRAGIAWLHARFTSAVRDDATYYSFLTRVGEVILEDCYEEMRSYLLLPDRGPGSLNVASISLVIGRSRPDDQLVQRWVDWVDDGRFDLGAGPGHAWATDLYDLLNRHTPTDVQRVVDVIEERVRHLLGSPDPADIRGGVHHLVAMIDARYRGAARMLGTPVPYTATLTEHQRAITQAALAGLIEVADFYSFGGTKVLGEVVSRRFAAIIAADTAGWTGHREADDGTAGG